MAGIKSTSLCLALLIASTTMHAASTEPPPGSESVGLHLPEYAPKLLREGQSRLSWHLLNEANQALSTGMLIAAGYSLRNKIDPVKYPVQSILSTAHVLMDLALTRTWADFALRQVTQVPLLAWRWYTKNTLSPWINSLVQESPGLLMGAWEIWIQSQNHLPEGTKMIHTGESEGEFKVLFSSIDYPHFVFHFNRQKPENCQMIPSDDDTLSYQQHLKQLACTAYQNAIRTLEIRPEGNELSPEYALKMKATSVNGETLLQNIAVTTTLHAGTQPDQQLIWLTDVLTKAPEKNSVGTALSPLSEHALIALNTALEGDSSQQTPPLSADKLTVRVVSGKTMVVAGLGDGAYLLSDHTDSQGLALPELWLGTERFLSHTQASEALKVLEEKRRPGPEYGAWRLLAAARSIAHKTLLEKTFNWLTEGRTFTKDGFTSLDGSENITQAEAGKLERVLKTSGKHVVLAGRGRSGKSLIANHLTGTNKFGSGFSLTGSTGFQSLETKGGHRVTELPPLQQESSDQLLNNVRSQLTSHIDQVIYVKSASTRVEVGEREELERVAGLFPNVSEAQKRISVAFNNMTSDIDNQELTTMIDEMKIPSDKGRGAFFCPGYNIVKFIKEDDQNTSGFFKDWSNILQEKTGK